MGPHEDGLVLDGGFNGLWLSRHEGEDIEDAVVCLEPVLPSTVWRRRVDLGPGAPEVPDDFQE